MKCQKCQGYMNPTPTVDIIAIKYVDKVPYIVLIKRKNEPKGWALPGGFVDYGESCEDAAVRELFEETNLKPVGVLTQHRVYSNPDRDPRQHNISIVFWGVVEGEVKAKDDAVDTLMVSIAEKDKITPLEVSVDELDIVFDHREIIDNFFLRGK